MSKNRSQYRGFDDWIQVFETGAHTDSSGHTRHWSREDLQSLMANHDPEHPAPLVVGHPASDDPRYGQVAEYRLDEAGRLWFKGADIEPSFERMVAEQRFPERSIAIDGDGKGGFKVRHIGFLGAVPPALQLTPMQYGHDTPAAHTYAFALDADARTPSLLGRILGRLREFLIDRFDLDTADTVLPHCNQFGNKRLMLIWPGFTVFDVSSASYVNQPASARALGLRAKLDHDIGWHKTLSNIPINGVAGLTHDVDWDLQNPATKAGYLNAHEVTTLINHQGFRFWGSRTCSSDPKFAFESAVRTGDVLSESIARSHLWAVDKPMSNTLIEDLMEGVNATFRELKAQGAIVGAECSLDPELNSQSALQAGKLWLNYDYTPVPPLEQLSFQARITNRYLVELLPTGQAA